MRKIKTDTVRNIKSLKQKAQKGGKLKFVEYGSNNYNDLHTFDELQTLFKVLCNDVGKYASRIIGMLMLAVVINSRGKLAMVINSKGGDSI